MLSATITLRMLAPSMAISAMASRVEGMALSPSHTRISTFPSFLYQQEYSPMTMPSSMELAPTLRPTIMDTLAP